MSSVGDTVQTIAAYFGNAAEWYDFAIYGFFSDTIAQVFFPPSSAGHANLVMSYIVFGCAFFIRPLGGIITGHIGDKLGRKRAVVFSLCCMTFPTVAMGCLPTYEQVGGWSTALLVFCRMLQGFSVGGQLPSSLVYTLETKPKEHWGFYGSLVNATGCIGSIGGNLVGAIIRSLLSDDQLVQWGWRVAFLTGILVAPVAAYLHVYGVEHNPNEGEFNRQNEELDEAGETSTVHSSPLQEALRRENWTALFSAFLTPMLSGAGYYLTFVWMAIFMSSLIDSPIDGAFWVNLIANIVSMVAVVGAGWLSDIYGHDKLMVTGAISTGLLAPIFLWIISWGRTLEAVFAQNALGVLFALFCGPLLAWLPMKFPPKVRLTSAALGYNLAICISAGFSPAVATVLFRDFGPVAPGLIYTFFAIMALIGMFVSTKIPLDEGGKAQTSLQEETTDSMGDLTARLVLA
mmetsp:Transcript_30794/g.56983  ORF Transcript_30794/g.56983 Transcript_30794/m.56983 type:complete len:459 (-) Transcript_30794:439-1815(-)